MKYYKVLDATGRSCHGGSAEWSLPRGKRPGKWMPAVNVEPCVSGYHVCESRDLLRWLGARIWVVEIRGDVVRSSDKTVAEQARLVAQTHWDERRARLFAADCAARVLHLYELEYPGDDRPRRAIEVARQYATAAAADAVRYADAVRSAAAAASDSARVAYAISAAFSAAAAADAVRYADAVRSAAAASAAAASDAAARSAESYSSARDAADDADDDERDWQTRRLLRYLQPTLPMAVALPKSGEP